jgi:hypothetical protein
MSWLKATLTRTLAGQIVHVVLVVARPELKVNHFLVALSVFFVAAISGIGSEVDTGAGDLR